MKINNKMQIVKPMNQQLTNKKRAKKTQINKTIHMRTANQKKKNDECTAQQGNYFILLFLDFECEYLQICY